MRTLGAFAVLPAILSAQLAIEGVTVIDPRSRAVQPGVTVLIDAGGVVRQVGVFPAPRGYRRVDGRTRYLIPGLWDCHVHLTKLGESSLALFAANGVTSVRDMGSDPEEVLRWRSEITAGRRVGPRIKTAGRIIESKANVDRMLREGTVEPVARIRQPIATADDVRRFVAESKRIGVDHLKVRMLPDPKLFTVLVGAARDAGLPLTGHANGPPDSLFGRMKSIEHVLAYPPLTLQETDRRAMFRRMRDGGTWMSSTTVVFDGSVLVPYEKARSALTSDPRAKYIRGYLLADWREQIEERKGADDYLREAQGHAGAVYRDLREMHQEGVKLLAGTDAAVALIYPGFDLHRELANHVERAGLSPMEALRIATHNPAEFYGEQDRRGGISAGQTADLVLLDRNPIENIRNTSSIRAVVLNGKLLDRRVLDRMPR